MDMSEWTVEEQEAFDMITKELRASMTAVMGSITVEEDIIPLMVRELVGAGVPERVATHLVHQLDTTLAMASQTGMNPAAGAMMCLSIGLRVGKNGR